MWLANVLCQRCVVSFVSSPNDPTVLFFAFRLHTFGHQTAGSQKTQTMVRLTVSESNVCIQKGIKHAYLIQRCSLCCAVTAVLQRQTVALSVPFVISVAFPDWCRRKRELCACTYRARLQEMWQKQKQGWDFHCLPQEEEISIKAFELQRRK